MGEVVPQANVSRVLWGAEDASRTETAGLGDPRPEHALGCCEGGAQFLLIWWDFTPRFQEPTRSTGLKP